jgi:uncharacterized protein YkwD
MPPAARRHPFAAAVASATAVSIRLLLAAVCLLLAASPSASPGALSPRPSPLLQSEAKDRGLDLGAIPDAPEYRTDVPKGAGFLGADAAVLGRSLARINKALGTSLRPDNRLGRLARWVYDRLGPDHVLPPASAFDLVASRLGLVEPSPHVMALRSPDAPRLANTVIANLARVFDLAGYTHIGGVAEYEADSSIVAVVVLGARDLDLAPVPRRLEAPGRIDLSGRLLGPYAKPQLAHTLPSGETRLSALGPGPGFRTSVELAEAGRHRLEIVAEGPRGPHVIANFPLFVAVPVDDSVPPSAAPAPRRAPGAAAVGDRLFELINADRVKAGLTPLAADPALDRVALAHSRDMQAHDFVAHRSPTTGSAEDRLRAAGITVPLAAECVGKGYSADEIHQGFMDSPGHRAATLLAEATHTGIGVVASREGDRTTFYVTELFVRHIPALGADAKAVFLAELNKRRAEAGAPELVEDAELSRIADESARELLRSQAPNETRVTDALGQRLAALESRGRRLTAVFSVVYSLEDGARAAADDPRSGRSRAVGLGLAQGSRPGLPQNAIAIVLIFEDRLPT